MTSSSDRHAGCLRVKGWVTPPCPVVSGAAAESTVDEEAYDVAGVRRGGPSPQRGGPAAEEAVQVELIDAVSLAGPMSHGLGVDLLPVACLLDGEEAAHTVGGQIARPQACAGRARNTDGA